MDSRFGIIGRAGGLLCGGAVMDLIAAFTIGLAFGVGVSIIIVWIAAAWDSDPTDAEFYGDQYD
jgi:tetrahydromethanopterin S-methyltransferase subunit F